MSIRPRLWARRSAWAGWAGLSGTVMALGLLLASTGLLLTLTAAPVEAATIACGSSASTFTNLVPGNSGTFSCSYAETAGQLGNPFTVTLDVATTATSGNGAASSGTATEALLDGLSTGLQVTITDSAGNSFGVGTPSCSSTYPDGASCASNDDAQAVAGATAISSWSDTFTIGWSLPLTAGNPYQGGSATVTVTPYYNGVAAPNPTPSSSPTGSVSAITSSATPTGGVSAVTTPSTGAGPSDPSLVLIAVGMFLLLAGGLGIGAAHRSNPQTP